MVKKVCPTIQIFAIFLLAVLLSHTIHGQKRPKIGLVLSGGGAKGMAHIGILKEMERAGLRPDYITGTSMGSIVGGLYATGYAADELEKIVGEINWDEILTNRIPLSEIAIEEKPYYARYIVELPVNDLIKVGLPGGLIEGQRLGTLLFNLTRAVHDVDDFNKLPIPFACVATDIATGQPVILNKGSLAHSLRASMAIPTVFTPVEIDGKLLVDGGLVRNFPVQEVIDMGADIVIGVFVSSDLKSKDELKDFVEILFQSSWVLSAYDTREQKKKVDYYIEPELVGYSTGSFNDSKAIIESGEETGKKYYNIFKELADSLNHLGAQSKVIRPESVSEYNIKSIIIEGNEKIDDELIKGKLRIYGNTKVNAEEIEQRVELLFGIGMFDNIGYELRSVEGGHDLVITVRESAQGKVKFAVHFDSENGIGVNVNYTLRNFLLKKSRAIAEIDMAEFPRVNLNYLKYVGRKQNVAGMVGFDYNSFNPSIRFTHVNQLEIYKIRQSNLVATLFSTAESNITYGVRGARNYINLEPDIANSDTTVVATNKGYTAGLFFRTNTLERPYYARHGSKFFFTLDYTMGFTGKYDIALGSERIKETLPIENVWKVETGYMKIWPLRKSISLISDSWMGYTATDSEAYLNLVTTVFSGGYHPRIANSIPFYGALNYDYSLTTYFLTKLDIQFQIFNNVFLTTGANFVTTEYPAVWFGDEPDTGDLLGDTTYRVGLGMSVGYYSIIGPLAVSLSWDTQRQEFIGNLNIGFYF